MNKTTFTIDTRLVIALLLAAAIAALAVWRPWAASANDADKQGITVTGEATLKAQPDEFNFNPSYQKTAKTSEEAISQVSEIGNGVVAKLKELGVRDNSITTNVSTNQDYRIAVPAPDQPKSSSDEMIATYSIQAKVTDRELAKKIQEYLATTPVQFAVTPYSSLSKDLQKKLETEARTQALKDARQKAEQTAQELGVRLGKVVAVSEVTNGGVIPLARDSAASSAEQRLTTPAFETADQEFTFTLNVTYAIR